jgi:hypothetical protein
MPKVREQEGFCCTSPYLPGDLKEELEGTLRLLPWPLSHLLRVQVQAPSKQVVDVGYWHLADIRGHWLAVSF